VSRKKLENPEETGGAASHARVQGKLKLSRDQGSICIPEKDQKGRGSAVIHRKLCNRSSTKNRRMGKKGRITQNGGGKE